MGKKITLCFCGTLMHAQMHTKGEVVSSIGKECKDAKIFDGPGSEVADVSLVPALLPTDTLPLTIMTLGIPSLLEEIKWVPGAIAGSFGESGWDNNIVKAMEFIKSEYEKDPDIEIEIVGWSRGAVTAYMFANALLAEKMGNIPVNIFAIDPVPGPGNFGPAQTAVGANVKNMMVFLAEEDRTPMFTSLIPKHPASTHCQIVKAPGNHFSIAGVKVAQDLWQLLVPESDDLTPEVGKTIRDIINQTLYLLGANIPPVAQSTDMSGYALPDKSEEREKIRETSFHPYLMKAVHAMGMVTGFHKYISDYNSNAKGKEAKIQDMAYPQLNGINIMENLFTITPAIESIRGAFKQLNSTDTDLAAFIKMTEAVIQQSVFAISNNEYTTAHIERLQKLATIWENLKNNPGELEAATKKFKSNEKEFVTHKVKEDQKKLSTFKTELQNLKQNQSRMLLTSFIVRRPEASAFFSKAIINLQTKIAQLEKEIAVLENSHTSQARFFSTPATPENDPIFLALAETRKRRAS